MSQHAPESRQSQPLSTRDQVNVLLEEYRALYGLLLFRLDAMERRLPIAGGGIVVLFASLSAIPDELRVATLIVLPASLAWLVWTTVNHGRSKEDNLRRIDEIERQVNELACSELLVFQSQHPNCKRHVAGRTGSGTVAALAATCVAMLVACHFLFAPLTASVSLLFGYDAYLVTVAVFVVGCSYRMRRYRYQHNESSPQPDEH